jgi:hypothetical protein
MNKRLTALLLGSHVLALGFGFAAGIYLLPLLIAPPSPTGTELGAAAAQARYTGNFRRDLEGSDLLHWGEGIVSVGSDAVTLDGTLAPGPDYKLYLSPEFVETEADFLRLKSRMTRIGDVRTFKDFLVPMPPGVDPADYTSVVVWCESFGQFITAARYRP